MLLKRVKLFEVDDVQHKKMTLKEFIRFMEKWMFLGAVQEIDLFPNQQYLKNWYESWASQKFFLLFTTLVICSKRFVFFEIHDFENQR